MVKVRVGTGGVRAVEFGDEGHGLNEVGSRQGRCGEHAVHGDVDGGGNHHAHGIGLRIYDGLVAVIVARAMHQGHTSCQRRTFFRAVVARDGTQVRSAATCVLGNGGEAANGGATQHMLHGDASPWRAKADGRGLGEARSQTGGGGNTCKAGGELGGEGCGRRERGRGRGKSGWSGVGRSVSRG